MNELGKLAMETADAYEADAKELVQHIRLLDQHTYDLKRIETYTEAEVANEVDALGKPKYSNEVKRKAEKDLRLSNHKDYQQLVDIHSDQKDRVDELKTNLDILKVRLREIDIATREVA